MSLLVSQDLFDLALLISSFYMQWKYSNCFSNIIIKPLHRNIFLVKRSLSLRILTFFLLFFSYRVLSALVCHHYWIFY